MTIDTREGGPDLGAFDPARQLPADGARPSIPPDVVTVAPGESVIVDTPKGEVTFYNHGLNAYRVGEQSATSMTPAEGGPEAPAAASGEQTPQQPDAADRPAAELADPEAAADALLRQHTERLAAKPAAVELPTLPLLTPIEAMSADMLAQVHKLNELREVERRRNELIGLTASVSASAGATMTPKGIVDRAELLLAEVERRLAPVGA